MKITVFFEHFQKAFEKKLLYNEPMKFSDHVKKSSLFSFSKRLLLFLQERDFQQRTGR